ncbi:ATP-binding protein [Streptomyces sp. NPDC054841]
MKAHDTVPLVGRDAEKKTLATALVTASLGQGTALVIEGHPGSGKSSLAAWCVAEAKQRDFIVLSAAAEELEQPFPLRPFLECLTGSPLPYEGGATPRALEAAASEQLLQRIHELCTRSRVALLIDDLHWADEPSLALWHRLSGLASQTALLLIGTVRTAPRQHSVNLLFQKRRSAHLDQLHRPMQSLSLRCLEPAEIATLARERLGYLPGPGLTSLLELSGGNPRYAVDLLEALRDEARLIVDGPNVDAVGTTVPEAATDAVRAHLGYLPPQALETLRGAALLGTSFQLDELAVLLGRPPMAVASVLEETITAGLVAPQGDRLTFRHPVVREALTREISSDLQTVVRQQAAQILAARGARAERIAEHLLLADGALDDWVLEWLERAAPELIASSPAAAAELLERAGRDRSRHDVPPRLRALLVEALLRTGRLHEAADAARGLLSSATDPLIAGEAAWLLCLALRRLGHQAEALAVVEQAVSNAGTLTTSWAARLQAEAALIHLSGNDLDRSDRAARRAIILAQPDEDPYPSARARYAQAQTERRRNRAAAALQATECLYMLGTSPDHLELRCLLLLERARALEALDLLDDAQDSWAQADGLTMRMGGRVRHKAVLADVRRRIRSGEWSGVQARATPVIQDSTASPASRRHAHALVAFVAAHKDDRQSICDHLALAEAETDGAAGTSADHHLHAARAMEAEGSGAPDKALAILSEALSSQPSEEPDEAHVWLPELVRLALSLHEPVRARQAAEYCETAARKGDTEVWRQVATHGRAMLDGDPSLLLLAADRYRKAQLPLYQGRALEDAAVLLARQGATAQARRVSAQAILVYSGLEAAWDIRRTASSLHDYGIRPEQDDTDRNPQGWDSLTPVELRISGLVAEGLSNAEIAVVLHLSRRTVQSKVSSILGKLSARSRAEIAREVARNLDHLAN